MGLESSIGEIEAFDFFLTRRPTFELPLYVLGEHETDAFLGRVWENFRERHTEFGLGYLLQLRSELEHNLHAILPEYSALMKRRDGRFLFTGHDAADQAAFALSLVAVRLHVLRLFLWRVVAYGDALEWTKLPARDRARAAKSRKGRKAKATENRTRMAHARTALKDPTLRARIKDPSDLYRYVDQQIGYNGSPPKRPGDRARQSFGRMRGWVNERRKRVGKPLIDSFQSVKELETFVDGCLNRSPDFKGWTGKREDRNP